MKTNLLAVTTVLCLTATSSWAVPLLNVTPGGLQGGNWIWNVSVTPTTSGSPLAVELGFRLSSSPLTNVTNVNPAEWDFNNPGKPIFGWEVPYGAPGFPEGIEINCTSCTASNAPTFGGHATTVVAGSNNEVFAAMGSIDFPTGGDKPFLKIIALGPGNGGSNTSSIQWLGAYNGKGRIAELAGANAVNYDIYAGVATQSIPEPTCLVLVGAGAVALLLKYRTRRES